MGYWESGISIGRSAILINHLRGGHVIGTDRLTFVGCSLLKDIHGVDQAVGAGRGRGAGERHTQGKVVNVGIRGGAAVRDGIGKTILPLIIFLAASIMKGLVCDQAVVRLGDQRVLSPIILAAVARRSKIFGKRIHDRFTRRKHNCTTRIKDPGHLLLGFGSRKKRHGVLATVNMERLLRWGGGTASLLEGGGSTERMM